MYSNKIMEEFFNPAHFENMRGASGVGKVTCENGDEIIKIFVVVKNKKVVDVSFQTFGGVVAIALTSFAVRFISDKSVEEARKISIKDILKMADVIPENRIYLAHAVVSAAKMALDDALGLIEKKPEISEEEKEAKRAKRLENKLKRETAPKEIDALELELDELRKTESDDDYELEGDDYELESDETENEESEIKEDNSLAGFELKTNSNEEYKASQNTNEDIVVPSNNEVMVVQSNGTLSGSNASSEVSGTNSSQIFHKKITKKVVTRTTTNQ